MECLVSVDWALLEEATALLASLHLSHSHPIPSTQANPDPTLAYPVAYRVSVALAVEQ